MLQAYRLKTSQSRIIENNLLSLSNLFECCIRVLSTNKNYTYFIVEYSNDYISYKFEQFLTDSKMEFKKIKTETKK